MKRVILILALCCLCVSTMPHVTVKAEMSDVQMLIGQQVRLVLTVSAEKGQHVIMPQFGERQLMTPGVEVLKMSKTDTVSQDGRLELKKEYTLTAFEDTVYLIPPLSVMVDDKEYQTKELALNVLTVQVDTAHPEQFCGPADVQDSPYQWSDYKYMVWCSLLLLVLLPVLFYLVVRLRDNKPVFSRILFVKHTPPHQRALKEIEKIKAEHTTETEDQKAYYTRLTDALRKYLAERFGFNALEMTTPDIIYRLQQEEDQSKVEEMRQLFETADLVKFAKFSTMADENDRNLANAVAFINQTKREEKETVEMVQPVLSDTQKRSQKARTVLLTVIWAASIMVVAVVAYVIWQLIELFG